MNQEFNLISVVKTLLKWKWYIVGTTLFAALAAVLVTLFILKPYYQSFAILYPVNQSMGDRNALFGSESVDAEDYYYGSKHDANRIITIATSSTLVQYVINKYNLAEHYEFAGKKYEASNTTEKFMKLYQVYKTDKDAVRINLIDTDKELAAKIVNDVVETIANETTKPIKENKLKLAELFEKQKLQKQVELDSLQGVLSALNSSSNSYIIQKMNYENALNDYAEISKLAEQYALAAAQNMSGIQIIEPAFPAERKIKPIRSKIVIATTILAFILACLGALLVEQALYIKEEIKK